MSVLTFNQNSRRVNDRQRYYHHRHQVYFRHMAHICIMQTEAHQNTQKRKYGQCNQSVQQTCSGYHCVLH